ncbi:MAG: FG-GAP-like repeat-containing protein [Phycisphaerales bacterium]|nr:FG-GAP-like repeat-containing protein [Phycisphaerales bacterium]
MLNRSTELLRGRLARTGPVLATILLFSASVHAQSVRFEDVAIGAGVDHLHWDGVVPPDISIPTTEMLYMAGGAAAGDFDQDGWPDLYVTRLGEPNMLFHNQQDGTFDDVAPAAGVALNALSSGVAWGDVTNDGYPDLYVLTLGRLERNYLYINDRAGGFVEEAVARGVAAETGGLKRRFTSAAFSDYDLDGDLDLFITAWKNTPSGNLLFCNDGTGHFTDVTMAAGASVTQFVYGFAPGFADIDNDGWPEILLVADFSSSQLFQNFGGIYNNITTTAQVGSDENGMGSAIGDYDNDGDLDWFVTSIYDPDKTCKVQSCGWGHSGNRLFRNEGLSVFSDQTETAGVRDGGWGWGASFFDYDNDGDLDLGMTNGVVFPQYSTDDAFNDDVIKLWNNDGSGKMIELGASIGFSDTRSGKGFLVFDYDRDGDQDVFIVNNNEHPVLYRNEGGNSNNWLDVSLLGHRTNRFGIGARVYVQAQPGGTTQMREVSCNSNFMSQNEVVAHFGVGGATSIHSVRVEWPASELVQEYFNISVNQSVQVEEPVRKGDVDISGVVDTADIVPLIDVLLDGFTATPLAQWAADVDGNGIANGDDLELFIEKVLE